MTKVESKVGEIIIIQSASSNCQNWPFLNLNPKVFYLIKINRVKSIHFYLYIKMPANTLHLQIEFENVDQRLLAIACSNYLL